MNTEKFKKGDAIIVYENNRICPEEHIVDECDGELGFWDGYIFVKLSSVNGTMRKK